MNEDKELESLLQAFHEDEEGLEILQVVLIVALAAIIFLVIRNYWTRSKTKSDEAVRKAIDDLE